MFDDEYFQAKSLRPPSQKDHSRNRAANYIMRHLKTEKAILKTSTSSDDKAEDFKPFVRYSVNKKGRWNLENLIHNDCMVLERRNLTTAFSPYFRLDQFPIQHVINWSDNTDTIYHIITAPDNYQKLVNNSFHPGSSNDPWSHRTLSHEKRTVKMKEIKQKLKKNDHDV